MLQQEKCLNTNQAPQYHQQYNNHHNNNNNNIFNDHFQCNISTHHDQSNSTETLSSPQPAATLLLRQQSHSSNPTTTTAATPPPTTTTATSAATAAWITAASQPLNNTPPHEAATTPLTAAAPPKNLNQSQPQYQGSFKTTTTTDQQDVAATLVPVPEKTKVNTRVQLLAAQIPSQIAQIITKNNKNNTKNTTTTTINSYRNVQPLFMASNMLPRHEDMLKPQVPSSVVNSTTVALSNRVVPMLPPPQSLGHRRDRKRIAPSHHIDIAAPVASNYVNNIDNNVKDIGGNNNAKMLPPQNTEKTIDFNRRRRRGRLRGARYALCCMVAVCYLNQMIGYASALMLLFLSLLLSLLVDYVNKLATLENIKQQQPKPANAANPAATATPRHRISDNQKQNQSNSKSLNNSHSNNSDAASGIAITPTPVVEKDYAASVAAAMPPNAASKSFAVGFYGRNCPRRRHRSKLSALLATAGRIIPYIYAFMLCMSILLPSDQYLVAAAKPKSATQLQLQKQLQQQQLQEQEQQQHHQNHHQHHGGQQPQQHQPAGINMAYDGLGGDVLTPPSYQVVSSNEERELLFSSQSEERFDEEEQNLNDLDEEAENAAYETQINDTHLEHANITKTPLFPKDLFTKEQLENGAVVCHIIGVIYMFVALAIVCDEFFVPSLDVIIEKLDITDDVAGATFMAAGGSAPELFTSVIGVFISFDDVGIGTIVGSAVFNILFVIGMCALFSKTVLTLTWWPLFRDCSFYSISLLVLIYFFRDNFIFWWEALILFTIYIAYVTFMKWNVQVERCVKKVITKNKVTRVRSTDQLMPAGNAANSSETSMATQPGGSVTSRAASETRSGPPGSSSGAGATGNSSGGTAGSTHTGAKFRHGLLQLMIHTIDPLHDDDVPGKVDEKATQLHAIASLKVLLDATKPQRGGATTSAANHVKINLKETTLADRPNGNIDTTLDSANDIEDEPEPLSMAWPDTARKRLTYILVAPLLIPMWLTLPDTRTPRGKKYFPITFIGSILWIAAFSYLMVWWANVAGDTARIPPEVMGLTFLAAGTSIPDLITSVIVARKGFGDMAVSSSVGSNIFDVTVGLPIPWLLFGIIYDAPVEVNSVGMVCSITILFMMLVFVVMSIACFRWKMNKGLGFTMFLLYFVFVAVSLMFEYDMISCPV